MRVREISENRFEENEGKYVRLYKSRGSRTNKFSQSRKWSIKEMDLIDFKLSPAPYNMSIDGTGENFTEKKWYNWNVELIDHRDRLNLSMELNPGGEPANSDLDSQTEELDENRSMEYQGSLEHFGDEFFMENNETGYVTELSVQISGSDTNLTHPISELNGDGALSNCGNENFDKDIEDAVSSFNRKYDIVNDDNRSQLIKSIMDCIFREDIPKKPDFEKIAGMICSVYPSEIKGVYSNGYSGKLYNAYNKRKRQLRSEGTLPKSTRALNRMKMIEEPKNFKITDSVQRSIDYLFEEQENFDVDDCLRHWFNSFDLRQFSLKKSNPEFQFSWNDWKPLECSWSFILICEDFIQIHGEECSQSLIRHWESTFTEEKLKLIRGLVKDEYTKENANRLPGSEEYKKLSLVNYINAILFPPLIKKNWRPSIIKAQTSVIMVVQSIGDISAKIMDRLKVCREKGMEAHPIVFAVEPVDEEVDLNEFVVAFSGTQYHFNHLVDALDVCFKMFIALRIPFPLESQQFYTVINELFYKVNLDAKKSTKVLTFLQKMQEEPFNN